MIKCSIKINIFREFVKIHQWILESLADMDHDGEEKAI